MRRRGVRPGADDREVGFVVAFGEQPVADFTRHVCLGPSDQPPAGNLGDDAICRLGREAEQRDLVGVFRHPERSQDRRRGLESAAGNTS